MAKAILIDISRCIGCKSCYQSCCEINELPEGEGNELSATAYTAVYDYGNDTYVRKVCMHCTEPACASVCPVGALKKTEEGPVVYDEDLCIGCRYCMVACPFDTPKYEWGKANPRVKKCIMCYEKKVSQGEQPACTEWCPAEANVFGEREELLEEARRRIRENPDTYVPYIYGEKEVGGTSVIYISNVPFEDLGFRMDLSKDPIPNYTWKILSLVPNIAITGGVLLGGVWWITNRRDMVSTIETVEIDGMQQPDKKKFGFWRTLCRSIFSR